MKGNYNINLHERNFLNTQQQHKRIITMGALMWSQIYQQICSGMIFLLKHLGYAIFQS